MLDLNYVRDNLEKVRQALLTRGVAPESLDDFATADAERRRVIAESDELNAKRNTASREIGALMKAGNSADAEARRNEVGQLKERISELDRLRETAETRMSDLLASLPFATGRSPVRAGRCGPDITRRMTAWQRI